MIKIDPLSATSLLLQLTRAGKHIGIATGFLIEAKGVNYLVTNWHVVSGYDPQTGKPILEDGPPDSIVIIHHADALGTWQSKNVSLLNTDASPRWIEHPSGRQIDVILLPLDPPDTSVRYYPLDLNLANTDMVPEVAMPCSIIGFPLGLTGPGVFPIWKTGHIASEPLLDYNVKPSFLTDATTRGGMSGSPVVLRLNGGFRQSNGNVMMSMAGYMTRFLGVYSG